MYDTRRPYEEQAKKSSLDYIEIFRNVGIKIMVFEML